LESGKPINHPLAQAMQKWQGRKPQAIMGD
jgi:hypothetical protein